MNKRNLALLISKHPLLRKLTEDKTIPNSIVARLIVEELQEQARSSAEGEEVINTLSAYLHKTEDLYGEVKKFLNAIESKKAKPADLQAAAYELDPTRFRLNENEQEWAEQLDQIKRFIKDKNLNEASRLTYMELVKRIKLISKKWQESNKKDHQDVSGLYVDMNIWLKAYELGNWITDEYLKEPEEQKLDTPPDKEQELVGSKIVDYIFKSSDLNDYLNNYANSVDIFAIKYPEYYKERKLVPKEYAANFKKEIKSFINDKQYLAMFKDERKRQDLINAIRSIYEPKISSFGTKDGREDLMKRLVPLIFEYWETPPEYQKLAPPAQEIVDNIASAVVDIDAKEKFLKTYEQNDLSLTLDFVKDSLPEEQVEVLSTVPEDKKEAIVKAVADKLAVARQELDIEPIAKKFGQYEYFKPLKEEQKQVMFKFIALLKRNELIENLDGKSSLIITFRKLGVKGVPNMEVILQYMTEDEQQAVQKILSNTATSEVKFLAMLKKAELAPVDKEPGKEEKPSSTTDPEKFDVDPELLNSLITASEAFIDEFYEKAFLKDQGILLKSVLTVLATIVEKEELEKAARRTSKPTEQPEEAEETETLAEQEEQSRQDPVKLRNIQVDLKSFIKLVKRSKDVLKAFDEFREKGKVVGSSYKEKFMNILKQLQKNIKALVRDISSLNLISEKKDVSETENKWSAIEKGYNEASRSLSNIVAAGAEDIESFDMEKNVNDAYTSLMSISGFFPSVNPFGAKTTKFDEYNELYTAAVKNIKSTIRDALELAKGEGGSNTANNTIESLKEFSGQIQSIFGVPSEFEDVQVKPNEPAAEGDPEDMSDLPRDLPTQIKDFLGEYRGKYERVKAVLDKGLFKEGIREDFEELKAAFLQADKMVGYATKDYKDMLAATSKQNIPSEETNKLVGDLLRQFVALYEELMSLYKRATDDPSMWQKMWKTITSKFNELKNAMSKIYKEIFGPLNIDLDLNPSDFEIRDISKPEDQGKEQPEEVEVEETFTEEIQEATSQIKKILPIEKFKQHADKKYYNTFIKLILIMYSKDQLSEEIKIGSISAPLAKAASPGMFNQQTLQEKLKSLLKNNRRLVSTISSMTRDINTDSMKILLGIIAANKSNIVSLDFDVILSKDFTDLKKDSERSLDLDDETDDSLLDSDDILDAEEQQAIQKTAKKVVKDLSQERPDIGDDELIAQAIDDILSTPEISQMVDGEKEEKEAEEKAKEAAEQAISPDKAEDSSEEKKAEEVAVETIKSVKEEDPTVKPEEVIQKATEAIESDDSFGPQFDREAAMEIAKAAFVSWVPSLQQQSKDEKQKAGLPTDIKYVMKESEADFPGFNQFDTKQQNAISIFMAFVSSDFDPANINLNEETRAERAFAGLLGKYVDKQLVRSMLKLMEKNGVLKTFQQLMADKNYKNKILSYVRVFKDIGEEPSEESESDKETFPLDKEFITLARKFSKLNTQAIITADPDLAFTRNDAAEEYRELIEKNKDPDIVGDDVPDDSFLSGKTDKNLYEFIGHKPDELKKYFSEEEIEGIVKHYSSIKVGSKEDQPIYILKPAVLKADGTKIKGEAILPPAGSKKPEEPEGTTGSKIDKVMEMAKKMVGKAVGKEVIKSISVNEMKQTDDPFSRSGIEHKELSAFPEEATGDFKSLMQEVGGPSKMYNRLIENKINPEKPFVYMEFREGETRVYSVDKFLLSPPEVKEESLQEELANKLKPLIKEMLTKGNKK